MAAQDKCCDQNNPAIERDSHEHSKVANMALCRCEPGRIFSRQQLRCAQCGECRDAEKCRTEPEDGGNPEKSDGLARQHGSENKGGGAGATHPAILKPWPDCFIRSSRSRSAEGERIAERRQRGQCRRIEHPNGQQRPQAVGGQKAQRDQRSTSCRYGEDEFWPREPIGHATRRWTCR